MFLKYYMKKKGFADIPILTDFAVYAARYGCGSCFLGFKTLFEQKYV